MRIYMNDKTQCHMHTVRQDDNCNMRKLHIGSATVEKIKNARIQYARGDLLILLRSSASSCPNSIHIVCFMMHVITFKLMKDYIQNYSLNVPLTQ